MNLGPQGVDGVEALFGSDETDKFDLDFPAVEVGGMVEEMDFEERAGMGGIDGGPETEVEDGGVGGEGVGWIDADAGGIDTQRGEFESGDGDVGGGEAELPAELPARDDFAGDGVGATEEFGYGSEPAFAEIGPDAGAGDAFGSDVDGGDGVGGEAEFVSEGFQQGDIAGTLVPEMESLADGDAAEPAEVAGERADEMLSGNAAQFSGEGNDQGGIDAEGGQGAEALGDGLKQAWCAVRGDDMERMGVEGGDDGPGVEGACVEEGLSDHMLVAEVDAIEHAEGHANAGGRTTEVLGMGEGAHAGSGEECVSYSKLRSFRKGMTLAASSASEPFNRVSSGVASATSNLPEARRRRVRRWAPQPTF